MLGITIISLKIRVNTSKGIFSTSFAFNEGLNVIRAENSSGKSTTVNAIAYGLGLEAILGPIGKKRVFPKSLYEEIFKTRKDGQNPYFVTSSHVTLHIRNNQKREATLCRDILGYESKIQVTEDGESQDYFLGTGAGGVGSAKSSKGFHNWLAMFLSWDLPDVIKYDGGTTKLYLECIFPLYFIEQKRGWSEIQANMPSYGIQNAKRVAIEFCLGIQSYEYDSKISKQKKIIESKEFEFNQLLARAEGVADHHRVRLIFSDEVLKTNNQPKIEFNYLQNNNYITIEHHQLSLQKEYDEISNKAKNNDVDNDKYIAQKTKVRQLNKILEEKSYSIETSLMAIKEIDEKILIIKHDYDQYQQLSKLKKVGANISGNLEVTHCPICQSELFDTLVISKNKSNAPMTLEENIQFLKNQFEFYESIKDRSVSSLEGLSKEINIIRNDLEVETEKLDRLRIDIIEPNANVMELIREKINLELRLSEVKKLKETMNELNAQVQQIYLSWSLARETLDSISKGDGLAQKASKIKLLEAELKTYLNAFGFNAGSLSSIKISDQTLRPEQEGYNIVAETSASDYIRIIWSYTLSLMKLAAEHKEMKHSGFVVFDEPRQHEASLSSFLSLIEKAEETKQFGGQVIFATSINEAELKEACDGYDITSYYFNDYILSLDETPLVAEQ